MPYIYPHARLLNGKEKVGDKQCVALVRHFTKAPPSSTWRAGETVIGNKSIVTGTGIATFEEGRYPNKKPAITRRFIFTRSPTASMLSTNGQAT